MNKWMKAVLPDFCTMLNSQTRVFSKKVYIIVETLKMIQLFSTLIPPEPSGSPPWNYSDMKFFMADSCFIYQAELLNRVTETTSSSSFHSNLRILTPHLPRTLDSFQSCTQSSK
jgi:hypothetical protein